MKKAFLILITMVLSFQANAQFKIHSNGYMSFMTTETPLSPISINCSGNANYFARYEGIKNGLYCSTTNGSNAGYFYLTPNSTVNYALRSQIASPDTAAAVGTYAMGIWGFGGRSLKNYGVVGTVTNKTGSHGVGVYGADNPLWISSFTQNYAGFFEGDVHVTSDLQVEGAINGIILGGAASAPIESRALSTEDGNKTTTTTDRLSNLDLTTYTYSVSAERSNQQIDRSILLTDSTISEEMIKEAEEARKPSYLQKQKLSKTHFALDADQLEVVFPDLVYEQENGTKYINYIEMIPILVKTISELNGKVIELNEKLKDMESDTPLAKTRNNQTLSTPSNPLAFKAVLKQNTPNPFSERTEIKFSLPEDAQHAYIYIFDMQGKMQKQIAVNSSMQSVIIDGFELVAGMYLYSLVINGKEIDTKKMILSK